MEEIDALNILRASLLAMRRAVEGLARDAAAGARRRPLLPRYRRCPRGPSSEGDARVAAISAASILAKVARDADMLDVHRQHPGYGFDRHKGYATPEHLEALLRLGACAAHRRSFAPVRAVLVMQLSAFLVDRCPELGVLGVLTRFVCVLGEFSSKQAAAGSPARAQGVTRCRRARHAPRRSR